MENYIKCLVWDLDNTLGEGTLLAGDDVSLHPNIVKILEELNERGILNSIASRNEEETALAQLKQFGLDQYFIFPKINFNPKTDNLRQITQDLNLGLDAMAFIDDSPFEREGMKFSFPSVLVIEAEQVDELLDWPEFNPPTQTSEARDRLNVYKTESKRKLAEEAFQGTHLEFLISCQMQLTLRRADAADIPRIVELAQRTNQFNATAIRYSEDEVESLLKSPEYQIYIAQLRDRFGDYGIIGVMILRVTHAETLIESLMVSCRVAGRGVSAAMLILSMNMALQSDSKILDALYRPTDKNRQLGIFYAMAGLKQKGSEMEDGMALWTYNLEGESIPETPVWLTINKDFKEVIE